jgi:hypothetical protein
MQKKIYFCYTHLSVLIQLAELTAACLLYSSDICNAIKVEHE